jgi:predicted lipid-binding transport protein (Tim44 family)
MPDSQLIGILVAAMVAGVLLFRLYTVLGRRTGHEPGPNQPAPRAVPAPAERLAQPADPMSRGLMDIELADRSFDRAHFLAGARTAYGMILKAFAAGDRLALRPLLSDDVYAAFDAAIAARQSAPAPENLAGITDARITAALLAGDTAEITLAFRAQFTNGQVQRDITDVWTFARRIGASDPNWTLIATSGEEP